MQASSSSNTAPADTGALDAFCATLAALVQANRALLASVGGIPTTTSVSAQTAELSSKGNGKRKRRGSHSKTPKTRKTRTLKDLVRVCKELGDTSDKSQLLDRWKTARKCAHHVRLRYITHDLVLELEQLCTDLKTQGGASGKVRDLARERYWEADSPLTSKENPLEEDAPVSHWTPLQLKSWALYLESQLLFASFGVRISLVQYKHLSNKGEDKVAASFWNAAMKRLDIPGRHKALGSAVDVIDTYFGDDWDSALEVSDSDDLDLDFDDDDYVWFAGYRLSPNFDIPIARFTSRVCLELKRMAQVPRGNVRAFPLALILRMDVLGRARLNLFERSVPVDEIDAFLQILLSQEPRAEPYPEHPLDCAHAFLYLNYFITGETFGMNALHFQGPLINALLPLVSRDLRREHRRNLNMAFGRRLPAELYEEILDRIENAHDLPKDQADWKEKLKLMQTYWDPLEINGQPFEF